MDLLLRGKTALIVGGASGIGAASAKRFIDEDARVIVWDIVTESELDTGLKPIFCDVTKLNSVELARPQFGQVPVANFRQPTCDSV